MAGNICSNLVNILQQIMQLFASQYLEDYGAGHPDRLAKLMPYFSRVLGQVNRARVVKERIFNFLNAEASKSPRQLRGWWNSDPTICFDRHW